MAFLVAEEKEKKKKLKEWKIYELHGDVNGRQNFCFFFVSTLL